MANKKIKIAAILFFMIRQISSFVSYFHGVKLNGSGIPSFAIAITLAVVLVGARWSMNGFDFSAFFSAGTDFVDVTQTPSPIVVQQGQGYDGQFFYRLALDPFDFSPVKHGITIDFPSYRAQRIMYPLLAWLFSFGGIPKLVPFALILVNILSFAGIFYFVQKITLWYKSNPQFAWYPFLIFGCYMTIAKDLSEVTELFFFTGAILFILNSSWLLYSVFATFMLLTRETGIIALVPLTVMLLYKSRQENKSQFIYYLLPFAIFLLWKFYVNVNTPTTQIIEGAGNITWPFSGIYPGLMANFNFSSGKNIFQFLFWISYFIWQVWMIIIVFKTVNQSHQNRIKYFNSFALMYISWFLFAICLSPSIYIDDWSFVRVFALWNMIGMILLIAANKSVSRWFVIFSTILLILTIIRLIIKL